MAVVRRAAWAHDNGAENARTTADKAATGRFGRRTDTLPTTNFPTSMYRNRANFHDPRWIDHVRQCNEIR